MRSYIGFAALCAAGMMAAAAPASAKWDCVGPSYACGAPASSASYKAPRYKQASYGSKKAYRATKSAAYGQRKSGKRYTAAHSSGGYSGKASYYWQPQRVASGGWFNPNALTAAHKTLPFGTRVRVTNRVNGKSVVVTINDRGPYIKGRIIDLSRRAAQQISMTGMGVAPISMTVLGRG